MEQRYTVTQTAEILGVRASVLRYWEEELELRICRNEQGHRYYTGYDITLLANIKELKKSVQVLHWQQGTKEKRTCPESNQRTGSKNFKDCTRDYCEQSEAS